jgi:hypothetical protein
MWQRVTFRRRFRSPREAQHPGPTRRPERVGPGARNPSQAAAAPTPRVIEPSMQNVSRVRGSVRVRFGFLSTMSPPPGAPSRIVNVAGGD